MVFIPDSGESKLHRIQLSLYPQEDKKLFSVNRISQ